MLKKVEYGFTPSGQFFQLITRGRCAMAKVTRDPNTFLQMIVRDTVEQEFIMEKCRQFWNTNTGNDKSGFFNEELYKKVLEAKQTK